jgi:ATP-dependent DNA helicase RecG
LIVKVTKSAKSNQTAAGKLVIDSALEKLKPLGIKSNDDLLLHLPLRYVDLTAVIPIAEGLSGDEVQIEGDVTESRIVPRPRRTLLVTIQDQSADIVLRFFNFYPSQIKQMALGNQVRVHGTIRVGLLGREMVHPTVKRASEALLPTTLTPIYPTVAGVIQNTIRKAVAIGLETAKTQGLVPETVPAEWLSVYGFMPPLQAIERLHNPPAHSVLSAFSDRTDAAWRRVIFDELLAQQLSLRLARIERAKLVATALIGDQLTKRFMQVLPFVLTGAQQRVWREIVPELASKTPMNRLLQGDVGSGKTIVAALAACQAIGSGKQAALMAPTEILAEQHLSKLSHWLLPLGVRVAWLAGSLKESAKKEVKARCAAGEIDLLIGTHALIQDSVEFASLGLAIVDEQHRFGVGQRVALRSKERAGAIAHQLMMSATPIPRTLSMSYLADLDVSVIDELPPGRSPVVTKLISEDRRDEIVERVADAVQLGHQVYWVCPLIEESETLDLQTATATYEQLQQELPNLVIGLVHGRLPPAQKAQIMQAFSAGQINLLVSTTVIEVGVDVPRASLMIIEHAERFGLAQLHQLRGRVGRGAAQSTCVLMFRKPLSANGKERLKIIFESSDGFEIARRDLQLRGPGEFLGARQSGQAMLRFADLDRDIELLVAASQIGERLLRERPDLAQEHLRRWFSSRAEYLKA